MRYKLNTNCNSSEIHSRIAESIDYSDERNDVSGTDNKLFYGINTPDGFLISEKNKDDNSRIHLYRFKAAVKDGKDGKPELHVHFHPGLIHLCSLIILAIIIIGKDHRTQLFNNPWMKALIGILLITIVLVPNILEYKKVKDNLLSLCNKQSD